MQAYAGSGVGVIGEFRAAIQIDEGVVFACGHNLEATSVQQRSQTNAEGEIGRFFELSAGEMSSGIVAAVGCIDHDDKTGSGGLRRLGRLWLLGNGSQRQSQQQGRGATPAHKW
jgi:hypothetical protein